MPVVVARMRDSGRMHRLIAAGAVVVLVAGGCTSSNEIPAGIAVSTTVPVETTTTLVTPTTVATPTTRISPGTTTTTSTTTTTTLPELQGVSIEVVGDGFDQPVFVAPGLSSGELLVVEREGVVVSIDRSGERTVFLDLSGVVGSSGIEQGLLGFALHPIDGDRLFVYYTLPSDDSTLIEIPLAGGVPDPDRSTTILTFEQPTNRHNAGMLQFGPDGYLYLSLGEGGAATTHAQDPATLLSSILRIDVDGGMPYAVPADNPFVDGGGAAEVWAYGLRNPWRFAIDDVAGMMYIADVGHSDWEEINVVPLEQAGYNFGWSVMEGTHCFSSSDCSSDGLVLPVIEYSHADGCSITGGFVYRGSAIPEIDGHFFYSDWCTGFIRSFRYEDGRVVDERDWTAELGFSGQVNSFGLDGDGELLIATWGGTVYRLVPVR